MTYVSTGSGAWTEPGAYEVAPGVHRVPLPLPNDGLRAVNVYLVSTPEGPVLIDSGWSIPEARSLLEQALVSLGSSLADVRRFLVTHVHRDHYTQAVALRREFGTHVGLGAGDRPTLEICGGEPAAPFDSQIAALRRCGADDVADTIEAATGALRMDPALWEMPDEWLQAGPITVGDRTLEAVETPGHTTGHLVFHDLEARLLFSGDHVLPTITPSIGFETVLSPDPLGAFLGSLALVRSRPDALLLPAHGPVTPSVHARVDELLDFHGRRLDECLAWVAKGVDTARAVAGELRWTRREHHLADLDPFNAMLAVLETHAHLVLLAAQGRVVTDDLDGVEHVRPA